MNNLGIGMGIPCPNCNPDGKDPDKNKRIAASLVSILATRSASCRYCGFVMEMDMNLEENQKAMKIMGKVQQELDKLQSKVNSQKPPK